MNTGRSSGLRVWRTPGPVRLELGGQLGPIDVAYETFGALSDNKDNAVLVAHALAADAHVAKDATDASVKAKLQAVADIQAQIGLERFTKGLKPVVSAITADQKAALDTAPGGRGYTQAYTQLFGGGAAFGGRGGRGGGGGGGGFGGGAGPGN